MAALSQECPGAIVCCSETLRDPQHAIRIEGIKLHDDGDATLLIWLGLREIIGWENYKYDQYRKCYGLTTMWLDRRLVTPQLKDLYYDHQEITSRIPLSPTSNNYHLAFNGTETGSIEFMFNKNKNEGEQRVEISNFNWLGGVKWRGYRPTK